MGTQESAREDARPTRMAPSRFKATNSSTSTARGTDTSTVEFQRAMTSPDSSSNDPGRAKAQWFPVTSWTNLMAASRGGPSSESQAALEALCQAYWRPVYSYIRGRGHRPHDAEDLTQSFFYLILEKNFLRAADRKKGRFRSFLLASVNHFLSNQRDYNNALKRGGGKAILSLDVPPQEGQSPPEPASNITPEILFERHWARAVQERVYTLLENEVSGTGKADLYEHIKPFLAAEAEPGDYREVAERLGVRANTIAVTVHRLRPRYWELLRSEIERTVGSPAEVDAELRHLCARLGEA